MSPYPLKTKAENKEGGFIALTATIILTIVLVMLITANGTSSFFARFDALGSENKRVSLGLSEACSNAVLLKAVQDYNYNGGDTITMSDGSTCHVDSLHSTPNYDDSGAYEVSKDITIKTSVQYPEENGSWSTNQIAATIKNPDYSSTIVAPDCTLSLYDSDDNPLSSDDVINVGDEVKVSWSTTNSSKFEIQPITNSDHNPAKKNETPVNSGSDNFSPVESTTYAGWATDANGFQGLCYKSIQVKESLGECADTVMMLDRTGSMTSTDLSDEKAAANSLVNLYAGVVPHPELGIGHFGDIATGLSAEIIAHLSNDYTNFASVINNGLPSKPTSYTNISAAIDSAQNELTSMSDGKKKVLILISDGGANVPCPGKTPCGGNTNPTATTAATDSANTAKDAGTEIYTIHYGSAGAGGTHADQDFLASLATDSANDHFEPENDTIGFSSPTHYAQNATGDTWSNGVGAEANGGTAAADTAGHMERYYGFGFNNIPSDANIQGIEINTDAWASGNSASLGPRTGSSFTNNNSAGAVDWINPNPAQNNVTLGKNQTSHYLKATNFGFSIPANAVIRGISVNMTRSAQYNSGGFFGSNNLSDNSVRLVKGNTITGSDKAGNQAWSTSNTPASYGSPSDLWNTAWTPSDINSSNFGLVFSVKRNGSSNSTNKATITAISMTVYYTLPINAACQLGVDLSWSNGNSGSWTTQKTEVIGGTEQTYTFGGATDQWGQDGAWASQDFSDANFRVRVQDIDPDPGSNTNCTDGAATNLDWIQAKVYYSIPGNVANADKENSDGDHFFISPTSADMSEVFDTVANLACPALSDPGAPKDPPPPPSPPPPPPPIDISSWNEVIN